MKGTYTAEGVTALSEALKVTASVTSVSLLANRFDDATVAMLLKLKEEKPILTTLCGLQPDQTDANFRRWGLTPQDAKLLAPEILVHASVTSVDVLSNELDVESADMLLKVKAEKPNLRTLCGLTHKETELELRYRGLGPRDAKLLAAEILFMDSLTKMLVSGNRLGEEGRAVLRKAVEGRSGFDLQL